MKRFLIVLFVASMATQIFAMEPYIKITEEKQDRKGKKYIQTDRNIFFNNGTLRYLTLNKEGSTELLKEKWGDYFFGLEFGRPKNSNGGWSLWNFFECIVRVDGKYKNIFQMFLPESVYITELNGVTLAEIISPLSVDGRAGKVSFKVMQFPAYKNWLFMKVEFIDSVITPWRLSLMAYPGNSNVSEERERWIATRENKYCVSKKQFSFNPESNALVMYSRFVQERDGNFIVFDASKFEKIVLPKAGASVRLDFFPTENTKEFRFAISYFTDKAAADELPRFLGESQDNIYNFMENIEWQPKVDNRQFNAAMKATERLIKETGKLGIDGQVYATELAEIRAGFEKANAGSDMSKVVESISMIKNLREKIAQEGLLKFK